MKGKKRFIALAVALVLLAASSVIYILAEGGTYTEHMLYARNEYVSEEHISASVDNEDVVRVDRIYFDDERIINVDFTAISPGDAMAKVELDLSYYNDDSSGVQSFYIPLHVTSQGIMIQRRTLNFDGYVLVEFAIIAGLVLVFITAAASFIECQKKAWYSYSMVAFGGVALFCLSIIVVVVYGMHWMNNFGTFLINFLSTGSLFAMVSAPLMLFISVLISVSNIWLIHNEGFRAQNMLGIALGVVWIAALVLLLRSNTRLRSIDMSIMGQISDCVAYVVSFMACMLLSTIVCAYLSTKFKPPHDKDYIIILGCCIRPDGTLTPILKGRADAAIAFEKAQFAETGKHAKFVPSGGQGADEVISESEAMKRYLMEQGYPEEQIIKEDKSVNTFQNIQFSRDKIIADAGTLDGVKAGVATTNYHIFRSYILAKKHGLNAQGISAKTKWYFFPNAFLREFVGLLNDKKFKIAAVILAILLFYIVSVQLLGMTIVSY